ncbi:MAG TPA: polysaccharide biosynthesis tyrosine autokinase [Pyrinomonadaceae bacterium]|nr:polysaccharide biosynthesis tyrosine autokinase [Pyrinomonadaceae bacterium]
MNEIKLIRDDALDLQVINAGELQRPVYQVEAEAPSADRERLREFLSALRRRWWVVAAVTFLCTGAVVLFMARQPDLYEAEAQVQVDLETVNTALAASKGGALALNPVNDPAYFNTQLQILTRPALLRRVVKSLGLEGDEAFRPAQSAAPSFWARLTGGAKAGGSGAEGSAERAAREGELVGSSLEGTSPEEMAEAARLAPYVEAIQEGLKVEPVKETRLPIKETRLINITFEHTSPVVAARIVNAVADTFVRQNIERKNESGAETGGLLQQRINELRSQIREQEQQLLGYARNHQILSLDASQNTVVERLVGLNRQLLEAENERKLAEAAYRSALEPGAAQALAEGTVKEAGEVETRLSQLKQRRAQLLAETTEEWPEVKEADEQIAVLERQLAELRQRASSTVVANLSTKYRQAAAREQALRASFDRQRAETVTQNEAAINYKILQQEIETNKQLLDGMLQRGKEHEALVAGMRNNVRVNDYAIAPREPVGPRRLLAGAVAFSLSLGFGVGLAVLLGYMDDRLRSADDVRKALPVPAVTAVPAMGARSRGLLPAPLRPRSGGRAGPLIGGDADAPAPLAEAFRQLRTTVMLSGGRRAGLKSLLVTSGMPGEGKTTTAVNTAVSLARTGAFVLLIDADLRNPRLHTLFGLKNERGLSTLLSEDADETEALRAVTPDGARGVDVLTSGPMIPESAELLSSAQMSRLVKAFAAVYDHVVIDSPPLAFFSDGVQLSTVVDGVLLVVNSGGSSRDGARRSYRLLQDVGANVCGVVLNNAEVSRLDYERYYKRP